ncbi:MAG: DUF6491 family protein [Rhodanobacteraceae bacterium]
MKRILAATLLSVGLAGALTPQAHAQTRATQAERLERFMKYVGAPISEFQFWSMYKFELVGPLKVVVWSAINDAYLLTVDDPCPGLEWARGIGVTSKQSRFVSSRFDYVTYGSGSRCKINEILPINYRRMIADGEGGASRG